MDILLISFPYQISVFDVWLSGDPTSQGSVPQPLMAVTILDLQPVAFTSHDQLRIA
jgi:hypothetical protein